MAAPYEIYVDQTIGTASGTGTSGNPYGTLQYALNSRTSGGDGGAGHRFNVYGTGTLTADLVFTTYGSPGVYAPVVIEGITSTPGDGGIGTINGGGSYGTFTAAANNYFLVKNMRVTNCGAATYAVRLGAYAAIVNCQIDNCSGTYALYIGPGSLCKNTYITDVSGYGVYWYGTGNAVVESRLVDGTKKFSPSAIHYASVGGVVSRCVVAVSGSANGISGRYGTVTQSCSVYSAGGTGVGIGTIVGTVPNGATVNNLVEGFSGAGGVGINNPTPSHHHYADGNGVYNCTTAFANTDRRLAGGSNNITLSASPFRDAANGDFRILDVSGNPVNVQVAGMARPGKVGLY